MQSNQSYSSLPISFQIGSRSTPPKRSTLLSLDHWSARLPPLSIFMLRLLLLAEAKSLANGSVFLAAAARTF
jgi:hypothetical protein